METVPKAVRDQAKRAEELHKQHYQQHQDTDEPPEPPAPGNDDTDIQKKPPVDDQEGLDEPPALAEESLEEKYRKLEQAHRALQGKYNAEVPRLTQQLREAQQKLDTAEARAKAQNNGDAELEAENQKLKKQLDRLREEFGDELADAMQSVAETARPKQDTPQAPAPGESDQDRFWRQLLRRVPDFERINRSQDFVRWLQTPSEKTGLSYQQELNEAGSDLDVAAVVDIVEAFQSAQATQKRPAAKAPEQQLAPPRTPTQQKPPEKPTYTVGDWTRLQEDIRKGRYRGREAEARALEAEIHAALTGQQT